MRFWGTALELPSASQRKLQPMCFPCSWAVFCGLAFPLQVTRDLIPTAFPSVLRSIIYPSSRDPKTQLHRHWLAAACLRGHDSESGGPCHVGHQQSSRGLRLHSVKVWVQEKEMAPLLLSWLGPSSPRIVCPSGTALRGPWTQRSA